MGGGWPRSFVLLFIAFCSAAVGLNGLVDEWSWWRNGKEVSATIVSEDERFEDGASYEIEYQGVRADVGGLGNDHNVGDVIEVLVNPSNQTEFRAKNDFVVGLIVSCIFLLGGAALVVSAFVFRGTAPGHAIT